jgi:perosamine synthetase
MSTNQKIIQFIKDLYREQDNFIPLHAPILGSGEMKYLADCIESTFVSSAGPFVTRFEQIIAGFTGAERAVAIVNGTSALHLALKLVGVERGTEVITQPLTFIATANAIRYCEADPVFLDVDMETLGLSPLTLSDWISKGTTQKRNPVSGSLELINKNTGKRISACVPMHTFGHPARIDEIMEICNRYNLPVVEDATESLGSYYKGKHLGTFGTIGVLSFNGNKIITTGGGGMLLFNNTGYAERAKHLSTQAKVSHPWEFIHDEVGYNYRMPNINAAIGLAQMDKIEIFMANKRELAGKYQAFFNEMNIDFFVEPQNAKSNYWLNCIFFNNNIERDLFLKETNEKGVMTRPAWQLMPRLKMYKDCQTDGIPNSINIADRLVNIPSSVNLTK